MYLDFSKGISIEVKGELGRYNTLPLENLVSIFESLQNLINAIAKANVSQTSVLDLNNFKVELFGFREGSAVPQFKFTPRVQQQTITEDLGQQRDVVNSSFSDLIGILQSGNYKRIKESYGVPAVRNEIVENLFAFTHSFSNSPVSIGDYENDFIPIVELKKLPAEIKQSLTTKIIENQPVIESYGFAKLKVTTKNGKRKTKLIQSYSADSNTLSCVFESIATGERTYQLHSSLLCSIEKEDDYYLIKSELLDLTAVGDTEGQARLDFSLEFDYAYTRYNQLKNSKLSGRLLTVKKIMNTIVKNIL